MTLRRQRSPSKSGMCQRPTPTPMIRRWPPMARSGTPDRNRIRWGRPDPVTGKVREFQLKRPDSGPHGLVADRAGNIWFTANFKGYIGKLDPRTG